jgi:PAS domain S-box-containing protein
LASKTGLAAPECWYWIRKLQARFFAGDYASALDASLKAQRLLWTSPSHFETAEYHFYGALCRAASCDSASSEQYRQHIGALAAHHALLGVWAENCPETFENRAALVGAEIARIEGHDVKAMRLYELAIRSARTNGFTHNEALAYELAARFYAARGFEEFARVYLRNARDGYFRWGAAGKVRQLDETYPHLRKEEAPLGPTSTIGAKVEHLDLATVIKVSQAVSGEIVLKKLLDTLMRTAIEQAGAERGLLILVRGAEQRIAAEATTSGDAVVVELRDETVTGAVMPESVLRYVVRTQESVILDDATVQGPFSMDPYIRQHEVRSSLCLPLINQTKLIGVLYLENNLISRVFVPSRIAVLKLLASQAAISLQNSRLYSDLQEREAKIRRLVDANIIGIVISVPDGSIIEANDAFLGMLGYTWDELASKHLGWKDLTPDEWQPASDRAAAEIWATGSCDVFEKAYFRKDGSRVPVLVGGAAFKQTQAVSFILDLTERKRAEADARESERRYQKVQIELARANRVATMGQLAASIAHEVKQPIAAVVTNAQAGLGWLSAQRPNLERARQTFSYIVNDGMRAGDVVDRIRGLIKNAPPRKEALKINEVVLEVMGLTRGEVAKNGVLVRTQLAEGLPLIQADRVQLQQVFLNLIINAVEAMRGVGEGARELLISTGRSTPNGILVSLRDSGPGFDLNAGDRLFQAFYSTKAEGMGMGLAICRSIVEAHGGRMWAGANGSRGGVFQFTLPLEPDDIPLTEDVGRTQGDETVMRSAGRIPR